MVLVFFKIFLIGISLGFLWLCIKKTLAVVYPLLKDWKNLKILKDLISKEVYDNFIVNQSIKSYISPKYQETHPYRKKNPRGKGRIKRRDLTKKLDIFLDHDIACRNLLILADSGMGKTCFALNYFIHNFRRSKRERHKIVLVPLGTKKADELILAPSDKKNSALFLDGFDEDAKAVENCHIRLRQLMDLSQKYKRVIITCSTQFIPKDKNIADKFGYERIGPEDINENHYYEFRRVYLSPFTHIDIKEYIGSRFSIWEMGIKKSILTFIENNPALRINPFLLSYFKEIFQKETNLQSINDITKKIIENWINNEPNWEDKPLLNQFVQRLAVDIYLKQKERGTESINQKDLDQKAKDWGISLYSFENNMRSLISQTPSGSVKFIHRSIMEYLFIKRLVSGDKSCYQILLTHQMGKFLLETLENKNPVSLKMEFTWLADFELMAHGLTIKPSNDSDGKQTNLFKAILKKNQQFEFLGLLKVLIQNPIFYEFGWDPKLNENLKKAVFQSKSSLMKLSEKEWTVMISPNKIEITKRYQKNNTILINKKDFKEYSKLSKNAPIIELNNAIGLKGLIMLNNINQSKNFCVFPDLKTFQRFTLYFWIKQFN